MKAIRIDKKTKLKLNKQTVANLDAEQMARIGSGNIADLNERSIIKCISRTIDPNTQSIQECANGYTHDTGIPPYGQTNQSI